MHGLTVFNNGKIGWRDVEHDGFHYWIRRHAARRGSLLMDRYHRSSSNEGCDAAAVLLMALNEEVNTDEQLGGNGRIGGRNVNANEFVFVDVSTRDGLSR